MLVLGTNNREDILLQTTDGDIIIRVYRTNGKQKIAIKAANSVKISRTPRTELLHANEQTSL